MNRILAAQGVLAFALVNVPRPVLARPAVTTGFSMGQQSERLSVEEADTARSEKRGVWHSQLFVGYRYRAALLHDSAPTWLHLHSEFAWDQNWNQGFDSLGLRQAAFVEASYHRVKLSGGLSLSAWLNLDVPERSVGRLGLPLGAAFGSIQLVITPGLQLPLSEVRDEYPQHVRTRGPALSIDPLQVELRVLW